MKNLLLNYVRKEQCIASVNVYQFIIQCYVKIAYIVHSLMVQTATDKPRPDGSLNCRY